MLPSKCLGVQEKLTMHPRFELGVQGQEQSMRPSSRPSVSGQVGRPLALFHASDRAVWASMKPNCVLKRWRASQGLEKSSVQSKDEGTWELGPQLR